jgi:AhpD family alkylhydroperoxidase
MERRLDYPAVASEGYRAIIGLERYGGTVDIDPKLKELIKIRASQINGCAYCLDMHTKDAIAIGEDPMRIFTLSAWRETPFFTESERAALALTEAVTLLSEHGVPDDVYAEVRKHFDEKQTVDLVILIGTINLWNRLAVSMRAVPGAYKSTKG